MLTLIGSEGSTKGIILCVSRRGYYLSVRLRGRWRRMYGPWLWGELG